MVILVMTICMAPPTTVTRSVIVYIIMVAMVTQNRLATIALPILNISCPVYIVTHPGLGLIDHYLVPPVQIVVTASGRQGRGEDPSPAIQINELMPRNIIVCFDVR